MKAQRYSKCPGCGDWIKPGQEIGQSSAITGWAHERCVKFWDVMPRIEKEMLDKYSISMGIDARAIHMTSTRHEFIDLAVSKGIATEDERKILYAYYGSMLLMRDLFD